jgi:hypothetical protein
MSWRVIFSEAYMMPTKTAIPKFITISELVAAAKVSRQSIGRGIKNGEIPHVKIGCRVLVPMSYLMNLESAAWKATKEEDGNA